MKNNSSTIIYIGLLVLLAVVLRPIGYAFLKAHAELGIPTNAAFRVSMAAVGIITFFGFVWLGFKTGGPLALHKEGMRLAIAASVVVVDLVLVTTLIFFTKTEADAPADLAQSFLNQFNTVVSVVVAFYFGTSAYVQVKGKDKEENGDKKKEEEKK